MSDINRQEDIEKFIRQSLLGVELVDTQFHLFSAKSVSSGRITNPRILAANNDLLTTYSKFFSELLSSPTHPPDPTLIDVGSINQVPKTMQIDDYGYTSDSDLDDDDVLTSGAANGNPKPATQSKISSGNTSKTKLENDGERSPEADADSFILDMLDLEPESGVGSTSAFAQQKEPSMSSIVTRLKAIGSRHILVNDTAFQTWYTFLNYLYTGKVAFLPLKSAGMQSRGSSTSYIDEPRCSPKSMYRLACKVGLDDLRNEAMAAIRSDLTEHNIITELAHSLLSRYPALLEMGLDVLYSHIDSPSVVTGLPSLARRIANKELAHGADVIVGLHSRLLLQHGSSPSPVIPVSLFPGTSLVVDGETTHPEKAEKDYSRFNLNEPTPESLRKGEDEDTSIAPSMSSRKGSRGRSSLSSKRSLRGWGL